ncbi:pseudaminic acid cytidylyltransferase [Bradyrhizobium sp. G127]|uniref:pseudaminic acid cytidylyltransferase n=1 Tax=Bradyrhizobium sp. G127 TaxID=2904800 RepID=UPI001F1D2A00|nr:pseudaminic acid cytidylyltransferase [Bradyrhizobium sp. G127]MCF2524444.1 pseudaminic acid cytidylyltransferase [Bradyrhizobium sp. G127]
MRIAIVPARGGSKRIPEKNIVDFLGAPLMSYSLKAAKKSGLFDIIHVSTDSRRIADVAAECGHPVDFMRAPELADDHTPLLPVLQWTLKQYGLRGRHFDSVCLLMPTAPLIDAGDLRQGAELFAKKGSKQTVIAVSRFIAPVQWAYYLDADGQLEALQPGMADVRSQDLPQAYFDSGTFVFIPASEVQAGRIDGKMIAHEIPRYKAIDIDDMDDLRFAEIVARGLSKS